MKIAIVGCGAMGSVYAGLFASAGHEVWAIDRWVEHIDAMKKNGLRLEGKSGDRTVKVYATTDAREAGPCDLVVLATKAMHVAPAAESVKALLGKDTPVLSIQNGLGGPDTAAEILGRGRVMVGVVGGFGASMKGPGHAHHNGMELVRLGEFGGPITPRLKKVEDVWRGSGFTVKLFDDIDQLVWEKLICNCAYSGPCALADGPIRQVMEDPDLSKVSAACATEGYAVAMTKGVKLGFTDPVAYVRDFGSKIPNARPSVLLDLMARRLSEIDVINGSIPRVGKQLGVPALVNETVTALVKAKERALGCK
ncbi:MAG: 2-dehydropantoate 2-reductase [Betaproteobacteria bacterium]|nr:2-dehydropantoate 2-reductase [Betaproteobacteria bacterium]MDH5222899.1 2-dehydropantoate 2-reductase [Betaproteobacteria bacterium]MDH5350887.1 2-dehydropantoate 2-reductase [Betaproteobacteria bacterium]